MPEAAADLELERVHEAAQRYNASRLELVAAVSSARAARCTWAQLGEVLGMSRQAAFKRFGADAPTSTPEPSRTVAELERAARQVFDDVDADRLEQVRARMPAWVASVLTADTLHTTWSAAVRSRGPLVSSELLAVEQGATSTTQPDDVVSGPAVVSLALHHERGEWHGRVSFDAGDGITGMLVLSPGAPAPF